VTELHRQYELDGVHYELDPAGKVAGSGPAPEADREAAPEPKGEPSAQQIIQTGTKVDGLDGDDAPEYAGNEYYVYNGIEYTVNEGVVLGSGDVTTPQQLQQSRAEIAAGPSTPQYADEAALQDAGAKRLADRTDVFTANGREVTELHRQYELDGVHYELDPAGKVAGSGPAPEAAPKEVMAAAAAIMTA
jgi:hypothetical protein